MEILFVCFVCLAASTVGGICGVGGGVVIKPILDATGIMSVSTLSFLSGLTVLTMACVNVFKSRKSKELDGKRSIPLGLGAAIGGVSGKFLYDFIKKAVGNDRLVGGIQAIVLGVMVLGTLLYVVNKAKIRTRNIQNPAAAAVIGLLLGIASSFLGIGGGPMNLAVLYYFFSMDTKKAAINSILVILLSQTASLIFSVASRTVPAFEWGMLIAMAGAGALGGFLSSMLHKKLSAELTDKLFIGLLVIILFICAYNAVRMLA
ncbi:MAG: sulfite exporter TauE/SafE family protein [Clostridia bacterium]|nr:sulfite exporter TauE/SafE family protein [Clostridia bacterium]